jgi:TrmH family RNA methyltransferase
VPHFRVVLVEPLNDGNVGAIARAMKNFGLDELVLVRPCHIGEEGTKRAMHGIDVLKEARVVYSESDALKGADFVAATSGVDTASEKNFVRIAMTPRDFSVKMRDVKGKVAILFGREDFGLDNELIKRSDFLITIPASPVYPILNISHAATILFYELNSAPGRSGPRPASELEKEKMHEYFAMLLDCTGYPEHKKEKTKVMFRRLMGRAVPSKWEFHTLMGVLDGAIEKSSGGELPKKKRRKNG